MEDNSLTMPEESVLKNLRNFYVYRKQ